MKVTKTLNWFILSQRTISISPKSIGFPIFAGSRKMKLWLRIGWGRCNHWIKVFFLSTKFHFLLYWFCDEEFRSQMKICGSCKSSRFYLLFFLQTFCIFSLAMSTKVCVEMLWNRMFIRNYVEYFFRYP